MQTWLPVQLSIITLDAPDITSAVRDSGDPCGTVDYTIAAGANNPGGTTYNVSMSTNGGAFSSIGTGLSVGANSKSGLVKTSTYSFEAIAHNANPLYVDSGFGSASGVSTFAGACLKKRPRC